MKETTPQVPSLIFSSAFQEHGVMTTFHAVRKQRLKMSSVLYFVQKKQMPSYRSKMYCLYLLCLLESGKQLLKGELRPMRSSSGCLVLFSASEFMLTKHWCGVKGLSLCLVGRLTPECHLSCIFQGGAQFLVSHIFIWYYPLLGQLWPWLSQFSFFSFFKNYFIVVQLQLSAFSSHPSPPTLLKPTSLPCFLSLKEMVLFIPFIK